jgi:hypothetical protein
MKKFSLIDCSGEIINSVDAYDFEDALEYFAIIKGLEILQLLKIFSVVENK